MDAVQIAKLVAPRATGTVRRPRVADAIERSLQGGICWMAAPAGYGKTTAMADFAAALPAPSLWYRVDEGDRDIAAFFHDLAQAFAIARPRQARAAVFGPEYAEQPAAFARRYFRERFARLRPGTLLVLDDLHHADSASFRATLAILLQELPAALRCACLSRTLPPPEFNDLLLTGRMAVLGQSELEFTDEEACAMAGARGQAAPDARALSAARGWAVGLLTLTQREAGGAEHARMIAGEQPPSDEGAVFSAFGPRLFDTLPPPEQQLLLHLSLLPEITADLATALAGPDQPRHALEQLHRRQLLVMSGWKGRVTFRMHDLMREFLQGCLERRLAPSELARLRTHAAGLLEAAGHVDAAIDLALRAASWPLARRLISARAEALLAEGRRVTLSEWCARMPAGELDAWLSYWLGVAHLGDDAVAEGWFARAWTDFAARGDRAGQCLTAAHAVLAKTDSWRTHHGLALWTQRARQLLEGELPPLRPPEALLVLTGLLRALDFGEEYGGGEAARQAISQRLLALLRHPDGTAPTPRLLASETLIECAGSAGDADLFAQAVDCVLEDLRHRDASPWALGLWLVAFGAASGRYFPCARRGLPYASAEAALREAVAIGEREALRGVEFGALYHLQLQAKLRNDWVACSAWVARLAAIADSRHTTQVAVVADCQAAAHVHQGDLAAAHLDCARFMAAIDAADEPPIERWPHFITAHQVLVADGRADEAARCLEDRLALFDGGIRLRTEACIALARAWQARQSTDPRAYRRRLRAAWTLLRQTGWSSVWANLPRQLAQVCADALAERIDPDGCRALIRERRLDPPADAPPDWPWALRIRVLGGFAVERDGVPLEPGAKTPARSLDILRMLALARDHTCALVDLHDAFWPDADGDRAKAACEQALHRLRRLLGDAELVVQRGRQRALRRGPGVGRPRVVGIARAGRAGLAASGGRPRPTRRAGLPRLPRAAAARRAPAALGVVGRGAGARQAARPGAAPGRATAAGGRPSGLDLPVPARAGLLSRRVADPAPGRAPAPGLSGPGRAPTGPRAVAAHA
ncbi:hypothetical protein [Mitsuaria sp. GD03876]|uniref:hypothetical protein n=1 Tax=Mitsuaria sp. GD03876 TaxID=2975399 RepID=UPI00244CD5BA|nr:hypothetical protein [Mitsuaria sp. GD03876]MDH0866742.1 hypothetical protein [Mitsuaria sp. GD03876]